MNYQKLLSYNNISILWLQKDPSNEFTKTGRVIKKLEKKIQKLLKPIEELAEKRDIEIADINGDNALTDPVTKKFIYDILKNKDGNEIQQYAYTPESRKVRDSQLRQAAKRYNVQLERLLELEVEFNDQHYIHENEIPANLTLAEREAFTGILIRPESDIPGGGVTGLSGGPGLLDKIHELGRRSKV